MFNMIGVLRFNNKMNKAAKVASRELGLNYLQMVSPLSSQWQMDIMWPSIETLQYYYKEEK